MSKNLQYTTTRKNTLQIRFLKRGMVGLKNPLGLIYRICNILTFLNILFSRKGGAQKPITSQLQHHRPGCIQSFINIKHLLHYRTRTEFDHTRKEQQEK